MNKLLFTLSLLLITTFPAYSIDFTIHDEKRATELTQSILNKALFQADAQSIYDASSNELQQALNYNDFKFFIDQLAYSYPHLDVEIQGYEFYGTKELLTIYATSTVYHHKFYYALTYSGTKSKDYKLKNFKVDTREISKHGIYKDFSQPIKSKNNEKLDRVIRISNDYSVTIEGITKTYIQKENIYVYTLQYHTEISLDDHKAIDELAYKVLEAYGAKKAKASGATVAAMVSTNTSRLTNPKKDIRVYRTVFKLENDKWVPW